MSNQRSSSMSSSPRRPGHRRPPAGAAAEPVVPVEVGAELGVDPRDSGDAAPVSPFHVPDVLRFALYEHRLRARRERQVAKWASGAALLVLGVLTGLSWHGHVAAVDRAATTDMVQATSSPVFTLAKAVSVLGSGPVVAMIALIIGAVVWRRTQDAAAALMTPIAAAVGGVVELVGKHLVARPRPVTEAFTGEAGFGFPSGHATGFTAMAFGACAAVAIGGLWLRRQRVGWWVAGVGTAGVAWARVAVGAHYAFDAAAGVLLGVVCALSTAQLVPALQIRLSLMFSRAGGRRRR